MPSIQFPVSVAPVPLPFPSTNINTKKKKQTSFKHIPPLKPLPINYLKKFLSFYPPVPSSLFLVSLRRLLLRLFPPLLNLVFPFAGALARPVVLRRQALVVRELTWTCLVQSFFAPLLFQPLLILALRHLVKIALFTQGL